MKFGHGPKRAEAPAGRRISHVAAQHRIKVHGLVGTGVLVGLTGLYCHGLSPSLEVRSLLSQERRLPSTSSTHNSSRHGEVVNSVYGARQQCWPVLVLMNTGTLLLTVTPAMPSMNVLLRPLPKRMVFDALRPGPRGFLGVTPVLAGDQVDAPRSLSGPT